MPHCQSASLAQALALAFAATLTSPTRLARADPPPSTGPVVDRHLTNGMTVIVQEDHRTPLVSLALRYDFDASPASHACDPEVTSLLMLSRTEHNPKGHFRGRLEAVGATNVGDSWSNTSIAYSVTVPANQLALPLWAWSDQMGFLDGAVDDALVTSQSRRAATLRRAGTEGQALGRLDAIADAAMFPPTHPSYAHATPEQCERVQKADVLAFHDAWITPDHATLAIVGDVHVEDAVALVQRYFETLPRSRTASRPTRASRPELDGETVVDVAANVPRAWISLRWSTPRLLTVEDARLDILAKLFTSRRTAWLPWKLVDEQHVATTVLAHQRSTMNGSVFEVRVEGAPGKTADELLAATDAALAYARNRMPTHHEVIGAMYEQLIDRLTAPDRASVRASDFVKYSAQVGMPAYYEHDFDRYNPTPQEVHDALVTYLPADRRVVLKVTPTPGASVAGDAVGQRAGSAPAPAGKP